MAAPKILVYRDFAFLLIPLLLAGILLALRWTALSQPLNSKGVKAMRERHFEAARKLFSRELEKNPLNPWAHLNTALAYDSLNLPLKALVSYKLISSRFPGPPRFYSYFNQAELSGRLGLIDEALKNYQAALDFRRKEQMIKENIELLLKNESLKKRKAKQAGQKNPKAAESAGKKGQSEAPESSDSKRQKNSESQRAGKEKSDLEDQKGAGGPKGKTEKTQAESGAGGQKMESGESAGEDLQGGGSAGGQKTKVNLSEENEAAILEEIEKQDLKVRAKTFQNRKIFGDKTKRDW